ncbi:MAG: helix-turn-helix domain-containing protein [Lysobacter sp.]|nr:helix-turn-helix domain-containing protein [Lysobacter sp.]
MQKDPVLTLASTVRLLMAERKDTQVSLSQRAGVSQRAISDLMNYEALRKSPTMRTVEAIGRAFDLPPWVLMAPDLPVELLRGSRLTRLVENYCRLPEEGRQSVERVAESEARYAASLRPARTA